MPTDKLAGRYERLWPLVVAATALVHRAVFYDNATDDGPMEVASMRRGVADYPPRWPAWTPAPLRTAYR